MSGPRAKAIRRREQTRFVSCSLPLAGHWKLDTVTVPIESPLFVVAAQYSLGLYVSGMVEANRVLERSGMQTDWLGDYVSMSSSAMGERNTRHDVLLGAWHTTAQHGLSSPVSKCFKGNPANPAQVAAAEQAAAGLNVGHIPDFGARGAARNGCHLVGEVKCYSCMVPSSPGSGSQGGIGLVGATRALGNTEEGLIRVNTGWPERGHGSACTFDHATGAGHVAAVKGLYDDCIRVKRNTLLLLVSETFGGVNGVAVRFLTRLAHKASTCCDEVYLDRRGHVVPFFVYHAGAISRAAAVGHAKVIYRQAYILPR